MLPRLKHITMALAATLLLAACADDPNKPTDTLSTGTIDVSADETYQPMIEQQLQVFDSSYPDANIRMHYKPESACIKDFLERKTRLILITRDLTAAEKAICEQQKIAPTSLAVARDAIAIVLHPSSPDSNLSMATLKGIVGGVYSKQYTVVFDNTGSSMVRYIQDSLLGGAALGSNVFAAKGNQEVVDYVANNPDAIGFVGVGYVTDPNDSTNSGRFISKVKVGKIYNDSAKLYYEPYQAYIALQLYPLTRDLHYIKSENYPGIATGFTNFLSTERGQLIFASGMLFPLRMNIIIRDAAVNSDQQ